MSSNNPYLTRDGASILNQMSQRVVSIVKSLGWENADRTEQEQWMTKVIDAFRKRYKNFGGNDETFEKSQAFIDANDHIKWAVNKCNDSVYFDMGCSCMKARYVQRCQQPHCKFKIYPGDCILGSDRGWSHSTCPVNWNDDSFRPYWSAKNNGCTNNDSTSSSEVSTKQFDRESGVPTDQDKFKPNKQKYIYFKNGGRVEQELASRATTTNESNDKTNDSGLCKRNSNMDGSLISPKSVGVINNSRVGEKYSRPSTSNISGTSTCRNLFNDDERMSK